MSAANIPMPPLELRQLVGPTDPSAFDNPDGQPILGGSDCPSRLMTRYWISALDAGELRVSCCSKIPGPAAT